METLKKLFPISFRYTNDGTCFAIGLILYILAAIAVGAVITISTLIGGWIPLIGNIIGWILRVVSVLAGIYVLEGIVIQILIFSKAVK